MPAAPAPASAALTTTSRVRCNPVADRVFRSNMFADPANKVSAVNSAVTSVGSAVPGADARPGTDVVDVAIDVPSPLRRLMVTSRVTPPNPIQTKARARSP